MIQAVGDRVYITCEEHNPALRKVSSEADIVAPTKYRQYEKDMVIQYGWVLDAPEEINGEPTRLRSGDKVYTHHFLQNEDHQFEHNGQKVYDVSFDQVYCKVTDKGIEMIGDWILVSPIRLTAEDVKKGNVLTTLSPGYKHLEGTVEYPGKLRDQAVNSGDHVIFKFNREYEIIIEDRTYYRMRYDDVLAIVSNQN